MIEKVKHCFAPVGPGFHGTLLDVVTHERFEYSPDLVERVHPTVEQWAAFKAWTQEQQNKRERYCSCKDHDFTKINFDELERVGNHLHCRVCLGFVCLAPQEPDRPLPPPPMTPGERLTALEQRVSALEVRPAHGGR